MSQTAVAARRGERGFEVVRPEPATVRCAIYTRKSTAEGLDSEFNTLDAQREAGEAYIASQRSEGWACLPDHYDDGGFTGGNIERPALQRLLSDINEGKIDCVVVYKVDRLSRSLLDFARIMETFEKHGVSFVSVTQQFNTSTLMGRLMLNVLLSFAQFEREIIGERTRDKMAAARKRGKWIGGQPVLGYDIDRERKRLVVNDDEAALVRQVFRLYLDRRSLLDVAKELNRRGARTKSWVTKKGLRRGGRPFDKQTVRRIVSNVLYIGKVSYRDEVYPGEHEGIVDDETFQAARETLHHNGRTCGTTARNRHGALLRGLLHCASCKAPMTHNVTRKGRRLYRYYVCSSAQRRGWDTCPTKSVPAQEVEDFVVERIREMSRDLPLVQETLTQAVEAKASRKPELEAEQRRLGWELEKLSREARALVAALAEGKEAGTVVAECLVEIEEAIRRKETRATEVREELLAIERETVSEGDLKAALSHFDPVWDALFSRERARIIRLLIERIDWDREKESLEITFRLTGIRNLAAEAGTGR